AVGEILDGDRFGHDDVADLLGRRARLHVVAFFLLAGTAQRGKRAGAAVILVGEGAGDGELATLAVLVAAAARARRFGAARRGGVTARAARSAFLFLLDGRGDDLRFSGSFGGARLLLGMLAR